MNVCCIFDLRSLKLFKRLNISFNFNLCKIKNIFILQWNHQLLSQANLERFAEVVHRKGSPLDNCFGFVDGTVRPVCRPGTLNQRLLYNGHKRVHGIKFQSVVTPNGMIANMYGPVGKLPFL